MDDNVPKLIKGAKLPKLHDGLIALDGLVVRPGEVEPYSFAPETIFKIASNIVIVFDALSAYIRARKLLTSKYQVVERMPITETNAKQVAEFMEAVDLLEEKHVELGGIEVISRQELRVGPDAKKGQNRIPPSVVAALSPILSD